MSKRRYYERTWCDYLTKCPAFPMKEIGSYECQVECPHCCGHGENYVDCGHEWEDRETINEHIRNALSPISTLISLIETADVWKDNKETYDKLLNSALDTSKKSIKLLCCLGQHSKETTRIFQETYNTIYQTEE